MHKLRGALLRGPIPACGPQALAVLLLVWLASCGGGAGAPAPNGNNTGDENEPVLNVDMPFQFTGSRESSVVPNQLSVRTGVSDQTLRQTLDKLGYSLVNRNGDFATVQVPNGDLDGAISLLKKEYAVSSVDKVNVISMPGRNYSSNLARQSSRIPFDPNYGESFDAFGFNGTNFVITRFPGQGIAMNTMGFPGAWDINDNPTVNAIPVRIAVIDAGFLDYSVNQDDIDETRIDPAMSGSVDAAGTFTPGFAAATWDLFATDVSTPPDPPQFILIPRRTQGNEIFSMLACDRDFPVNVWGNDIDQGGTIDETEVWNISLAGMNPFADYILIKTGTENAGAWTFSDNELAASINHAVTTANADIIILGMFGQAPVGGNVSAAIAAARASDCLVIAPAGDVMASWDGAAFAQPPVDIVATSVSPASDPNCVSVAGTGLGREPALGDVDFGAGPIPNLGTGWVPRITPAIFDTHYAAVAPYSNFNATIAAHSFGIGMSFAPFLANSGSGSQADPFVLPEGAAYNFSLDRISSVNAAAYVAGAASIVYQALAVANGGAFPADVDQIALDTLLQTHDFAPLARIDSALTEFPNALANGGGYLNANKAAMQAISGGTLFQDPLAFIQLQLNQPLNAVTIGTDVQLTVDVVNGSGPFSISVDWGNGAGPQVTDPWVPGTIVTLPGGYSTLGVKAINIEVTDSANQTITASDTVFVINPLTASVTITDQSGDQVALTGLDLATNYVFELRAANLYTGTFDHDDNPATAEIPNVTTFTWDFDDGTPPVVGTAPTHAYTAPGAYAITVTAEESFRPDQVFTINVNVS